jgi:hypothetical protein
MDGRAVPAVDGGGVRPVTALDRRASSSVGPWGVGVALDRLLGIGRRRRDGLRRLRQRGRVDRRLRQRGRDGPRRRRS